MTVADIAGLILAGIAALGLVVAIVGWFYKRGGQEKELTIAMRDNAKAVRELSGKFDAFGLVHKALEDRVDDHETRISVIEAQHGIATAISHARSQGGH